MKTSSKWLPILLLILLFASAGLGLAQEIRPVVAATPAASHFSPADTAWMLVCTGLVLLMTPGLACFYGGLVRRKNVLGTMMQSMAAMALIGAFWMIGGYSLAFGPDLHGLIGSLKYAFLVGVDGQTTPMPFANTIPHLTFMSYQGMFAIITPALIGGAIAERMKFSAFCWFMVLWTLLVYIPLCHWVWADGGWMAKMGVLDFAGGIVVHISSGFSALIACLMLGRRRDFPREPIIPHNLPLVLLGGGLLWFGWFGFNAGSSYHADGIAASALVNTHTAAAFGALTWMTYDWLRFGKPTALGTISGSVAGLGAITPASGFVTPVAAMAIGITSGLCCATFVNWRTRRGIDDSLDTFGVHGIGGTVGTLLAGVFAVGVVNPAGHGLFDHNPHQFMVQLEGVVITYVYAGALTWGILKVISLFDALRLRNEDEDMGLDQTQHGEEGYTF